MENKIENIVKFDTRTDTSIIPDAERVKKAVVAVSGGMDSATCLFHAIKLYGAENVVGVSMYYGQRHDVELSKAKSECERLGVKHFELDLTPIFSINKNISALFKDSEKEIVQDKDYATIMHEKIENGEAPISDEYIPNRNSLFLNILCAIGLQKFENHPFAIFAGIHQDDILKQEGSNVGAYPDCSLEFAVATNKALQLSTSGICHVYTPLVNKTKAQVALFGVENGMAKEDFNETWSCYKGVEEGRDKQCGHCPTCVSEDSLITMKDGSQKMIKDIKVGDEILSVNENKEIVPTKVIELLDNGSKECVSLNDLKITNDHVVWKISEDHISMGFDEVQNLSEKDYVLKLSNNSVDSMSEVKVGKKESVGVYHVFDINTETHTFFANGILVHNCIDRLHALVDSGVFKSVKDITDNYDLTEEEAEKYFK